MASPPEPPTPHDDWYSEDGTRPPYQPLLGEWGAEVLRYAATQLESGCSTIEQGATMLRDMAWAYAAPGRSRHRR